MSDCGARGTHYNNLTERTCKSKNMNLRQDVPILVVIVISDSV